MAVQGGCYCGAVRYVLHGDAAPRVVCCHCRDCQTRTGSAFDQTAFVPVADLEVSGELLTSTVHLPSGTASLHHACATCLGGIYDLDPRLPDHALLRAGTLDDSESIEPVAHIYASSKQHWVSLPAGVPAFDRAPPAEAFRTILAR